MNKYFLIQIAPEGLIGRMVSVILICLLVMFVNLVAVERFIAGVIFVTLPV